MFACDSLITTAAKRIEILLIKTSHDFGYIFAGVIPSVGNLVWSGNRSDREFRWRDYESFINKDVCTCGMINHHQTKLVVVIGLPELCGDAQVVIAISRRKLIAAYLVPFLRILNSGSAKRVNSQSDR